MRHFELIKYRIKLERNETPQDVLSVMIAQMCECVLLLQVPDLKDKIITRTF